MRGGSPQSGVKLVLRLGLDGDVPDYSTFSKNRHGRFRESDLLRRLFETVCGAAFGRGWSAEKDLWSMPA
jgi:transposase